jgi:hypothetical protein
MDQAQAPSNRPGESGQYEIRVQGHLAGRWTAWFDGLTLIRKNDGTTLIRGPAADQAALHGLLQKVRDTGLPLVSVTQLEPDAPASPPTDLDSSSHRSRRPT